MLDVLLVKIQPTDLLSDQRPKDYESFPNNEPLDFEISVSNGEPLQFTVSKEYYIGSDVFYEKDISITKELGASYAGYVVGIDRYPVSQFWKGVRVDEERNSGICRYEVKYRSTDFAYDSVVLLIPNQDPVILADLNFAYGGASPKGYCSSFILFEKNVVLSVKSPLGEVIGIVLKHSNESALEPDSKNLGYTLSFEKVSLPSVILQKLLETKPQSESQPHGETNG